MAKNLPEAQVKSQQKKILRVFVEPGQEQHADSIEVYVVLPAEGEFATPQGQRCLLCDASPPYTKLHWYVRSRISDNFVEMEGPFDDDEEALSSEFWMCDKHFEYLEKVSIATIVMEIEA